MLCNCPSGTFFFFIFHSYSFTTAGFKSFLLLFVPSAQWSKQQDWSYTAFWYCSKCSSIDMGWECTDWKKRAKIEIRFLFFEPFSVQQNVSNLKAATLAAYRHANESWSDEFCINSPKKCYRQKVNKKSMAAEGNVTPLYHQELQFLFHFRFICTNSKIFSCLRDKIAHTVIYKVQVQVVKGFLSGRSCYPNHRQHEVVSGFPDATMWFLLGKIVPSPMQGTRVRCSASPHLTRPDWQLSSCRSVSG